MSGLNPFFGKPEDIDEASIPALPSSQLPLPIPFQSRSRSGTASSRRSLQAGPFSPSVLGLNPDYPEYTTGHPPRPDPFPPHLAANYHSSSEDSSPSPTTDGSQESATLPESSQQAIARFKGKQPMSQSAELRHAAATLGIKNQRLKDVLSGAQEPDVISPIITDILTGYPVSLVMEDLAVFIDQYRPSDDEIPPGASLFWDISHESPNAQAHPRPATLEAACFALAWACHTKQCIATITQLVNEVSRHLAHARQANADLVNAVLLRVLALPNLSISRGNRDGWDHMLIVTLGIALRALERFGPQTTFKERFLANHIHLRHPYQGLIGALGGDQNTVPVRVRGMLETRGYMVDPAGGGFGLLTCEKLVVAVHVGQKRIQIQQRDDILIQDEAPGAGTAKAWAGRMFKKWLPAICSSQYLVVGWKNHGNIFEYKWIRLDRKATAWWEEPVRSLDEGTEAGGSEGDVHVEA